MQTWVDGHEDSEFVGVGARFGQTIESKEKHANRTKLSLADPADCCTPPTKVLATPPPPPPSHTHTQALVSGSNRRDGLYWYRTQNAFNSNCQGTAI